MPRSLVHVAALLLPLAAAAGLLVAPARAEARAATCGAGSYAYAGVMGTASVAGVAATITSLEAPVVASGHVAGWVGVGGAGIGPNGADDWLQVGLNSVPGSGNKLYYEVAQPGSPVAYHQLDSTVPAGRQLRLAVLEMAGR